MKRISFIFSLLIFQFSFADQLSINVFSLENIITTHFTVNKGSYKVMSDSVELGSIEAGTLLKFSLKEKNLHFILQGKSYSRKSILLKAADPSACFKITTNTKHRHYEESLKLTAFSKTIQLVNIVDLEKYVAGVVESEAGYKLTDEYYKLQAIICRTYAMKNIHRHELDGFQLCDNVHCQAYYGRSQKVTSIINATMATSGMIITDTKLDLIDATFHSNCGGQTCNSEDVWSKEVPYLRSVTDTFCTKSKNANWKKVIPKQKWNSYLKSIGIENVGDTIIDGEIFYVSSEERVANIYFPNGKIKAAQMRNDLHLKSAYFEVKPKNDSIYIIGKGYGHGVGMCQEGAMKMAKLGYTYSQIINFYFQNVLILNLSSLEFFRKD